MNFTLSLALRSSASSHLLLLLPSLPLPAVLRPPRPLAAHRERERGGACTGL
jgi:hypothetical protein